MLGKNIAIKGIFTIILFITMGFSQVSLEIKYVDIGAGTLDIYMSNNAGCSYCPDPQYNNNTLDWVGKKGDCEYYGDTTWVAYEQMTEAECAAIPGFQADESDPIDGGWWFDGLVGGFQFYLPGVTVTGVSGGSAEAAGFTTQVSPVVPAVIGFSLTGSTIPLGTEVLLTQVSFTTFEETSICFDPDTGSGGYTAISDGVGVYVAATWGGCYCVIDSEVDANGNIIGDGVCDTDDNCPAVLNSNQLDTDGDGAGDACDEWYYDANNDQDGDGIAECTLSLSECSNISGVQNDNCPETANGAGEDNQLDTDGDNIGDACDTCPYDNLNDIDGDGVCYCTLDDCTGVTNIDNCRSVANEDQLDTDADGADGVGDACDNCPLKANAPTDCDSNAATPDIQCDADADDVGDACDNCVYNTNTDQLDTDADGADGVGDACDNCSAVANADQADTTEINVGNDPDFVGDACDVCADYDDSEDADSDGVPDGCDLCEGHDDSIDADGDEVPDGCDVCAETAADTDVNSDGCSEDQLSISQVGTALPEEFSISQNFPNPFNPITSITFDVAEMDEVSLIVYDLTGKEVATLVSGTYTPGTYNVEWNAVNNAGDGIVSGMYIYRYISSEKAITRKMLYLK